MLIPNSVNCFGYWYLLKFILRFSMSHFCFSVFSSCGDTTCQYERCILFPTFRVIRTKRRAPMSIIWFVIKIHPNLSLLHLIKMSRKGMATLLYSIVNWINGFIEFRILSKSLGLALFFSNRVSSRKQLQFLKI